VNDATALLLCSEPMDGPIVWQGMVRNTHLDTEAFPHARIENFFGPGAVHQAIPSMALNQLIGLANQRLGFTLHIPKGFLRVRLRTKVNSMSLGTQARKLSRCGPDDALEPRAPIFSRSIIPSFSISRRSATATLRCCRCQL